MVKFALALLVVACSAPAAPAVLMMASTACVQPPDAAVDALVDVAPDSTDAAPDAAPGPLVFTRSTIMAGSTSGSYRGADGVDVTTIDGEIAFVVPWEQGGAVTTHRGGVTTTIATGQFGAEDARWGDLDGDGHKDVAVARDSDGRIALAFAPATGSTWTTITLTASLNHAHWMQIAIADADGDGLVDVIAGGRAGTATVPATIAYFKNPGPAAARNASAWTYNMIDIAGWTMSLRAITADGTLRLVVSDKLYYSNTAGVRQYDRMGSRWISRDITGAWVNHRIAAPPAGGSSATGMLDVVDWDGDGILDVIDGSGVDGSPNVVTIRRNAGDWLTWTSTSVPVGVANVGTFQSVLAADIDGDGRMDIAVSTTEDGGVCCGPKIGVYAMLNKPTAWGFFDVSGTDGGKFDNMVWVNSKLYTTEQTMWDDPAGVGHGHLGFVEYHRSP